MDASETENENYVELSVCADELFLKNELWSSAASKKTNIHFKNHTA